MAIKRYYRVIKPDSGAADVSDNIDIVNGGHFSSYSWYHRLVRGSASRMINYREYDLMDTDTDISRALDIVAEEMTGNTPKNRPSAQILIEANFEERIKPSVVNTLTAALKTFCQIHDLGTRLYTISRLMIKTGDAFYIKKGKRKKWKFVHPKHVIAAKTAVDDVTDIKGWYIREDINHIESQGVGTLGTGGFNLNANNEMGEINYYTADQVVRFTLSDESIEEAPFGRSTLKDIFKTFKQKELLEDAIIIYRISRAPERRVFYIDVGKMHPGKIAGHLEQIKNEIKQKKIPSTGEGGKATVESIYNPQSQNEDFFFAVRPDGGGSRVETLPGGQGLGELTELDYFYKKCWRGLRIPQSYIDSSSEGGSPFNDGKVGIAYLQEIKFSLYIERLQSFIEKVLDFEFKAFLRDNGIVVDPTVYRVILPPPSNFSKSRDQAIDADLIGTYSTAAGFSELSPRFKLRKYLGLTHAEIIENERLKREEIGIPLEGALGDLVKIYNPEQADASGFDAGMGGMGGGGSSFDGDIGGDDDLGGDDDVGDAAAETPTDDAAE